MSASTIPIFFYILCIITSWATHRLHCGLLQCSAITVIALMFEQKLRRLYVGHLWLGAQYSRFLYFYIESDMRISHPVVWFNSVYFLHQFIVEMYFISFRYAPSLRQLRQYALVLVFPMTLASRLAARLQQVIMYRCILASTYWCRHTFDSVYAQWCLVGTVFEIPFPK